MTDRLFTLASGRKVGVTSVGEPFSTRVVVMCHPMPGAGDFDPRPIVSRGDDVRILAIDRPGYGGSEPLRDGESTSVQARADDIAEFLTSTEMVDHVVGGPHYVAVGWGFGGAVALSLATRYSQLIASSAVVGLSEQALLRAKEDPVPKLVGGPPAPGAPTYSWDALGVGHDDPALGLPGVAEALEGMLAEAAAHGTTGFETDSAAAKDLSWAEELGTLSSPVTLIYGMDDPCTDSEPGAWLVKRLPHARIAKVKDGGALTIVSSWTRILERVMP